MTAERHGWGTVTAKGSGEGDPNVLTLKDATKIRLVEPGSVKWRQHFIESSKDDEQGRSCVCPKGPDGRANQPCPCCMKPVDEKGNQRFSVSRRFATNVWDYDSGSVKVLIGGPQIFEEFDTRAAAGLDPTACDWIIHKVGEKKQTKYKMIPANDAPFAEDVKPGDLHDLDKYAMPDTAEQIFEKMEAMGIDYDALEIPTFTLDKAESFQMPYGKFRGLTMEAIYATDKEYMAYLYNAKREQGSYGDPVFIAMHTLLEDRGEVEPLDEFPEIVRPSGNAKAAEPEPSAGTVCLVGPDGNEMDVPEGAVEAMLSAGFSRPEPEPEVPADDQVMLVAPDGTESAFPSAVVDALLQAGYKPVDQQAAAPAEPDDDDQVIVDIAGTQASMAYKDAKGLITSGTATLVLVVGVTDVTADPEPYKLPADDDEVQVKLRALPTPIAIPFKDARAIVLKGDGVFEDAQLDAAVREDAGDDRDQAAATAAATTGDPHPPAGSSSGGPTSGDGGPADLSPALTVQVEDGWTHPALDGDVKKTKGAVTQALNRLKKSGPEAGATQASTSGAGGGSAPAASSNGDGGTREEKLNTAKDLVATAGFNDFNKMIDLFESVSEPSKRNISDFTEADLDRLITKLQAA